MLRLLVVVLLALVAAFAALAMTFTAATVPVAGDFAVALPAANPPAELRIATVDTGRMLSRAGLAYRGGSFLEEREFGMAPVLVQHPLGALLIDAGFGRNVDAHFRTTPWLMQATSRYEKGTPAAAQLRAAGIEPAQLLGVVLTHAHWDHVSGLDDLRAAPVWLPQAERDFIDSGNENAALAKSFGALHYKVFDFPDGEYLGFGSSFDVFKDGAVVVVPAPGHTPGSVIVFVTLAGGARYAFVGDLAWQKEGIELPAERAWPLRRLIGENDAQVRAGLARMHRLLAAVPNLTVVPAHDQRVLDTLPQLGGDR